MRDVVVTVFLCGAVAIVAGYLPRGAVIAAGPNTMYECAGGNVFALTLVLLLLPGIPVFHHPSWPRIVAWIAWAVACIAALFVMTTDDRPLWHAHGGVAIPLWPASITDAFVVAVMCSVVIILPVVRLSDRTAGWSRGSRSPSSLPIARLHRGG